MRVLYIYIERERERDPGSREPGSRAQFPAGGLGVAFFATGPGCGLKVYIFLTLESKHVCLIRRLQASPRTFTTLLLQQPKFLLLQHEGRL